MDRARHIQMLRSHVVLGEKHVASQRAIIKRLAELGADDRLAVELLASFEASLAEHRRSLRRALTEKA